MWQVGSSFKINISILRYWDSVLYYIDCMRNNITCHESTSQELSIGPFMSGYLKIFVPKQFVKLPFTFYLDVCNAQHLIQSEQTPKDWIESCNMLGNMLQLRRSDMSLPLAWFSWDGRSRLWHGDGWRWSRQPMPRGALVSSGNLKVESREILWSSPRDQDCTNLLHWYVRLC